MKIVFLFFSICSITVFAQTHKVALIIGDDCKKDQNMAKFGADTAKAYKARGYQVTSLYGSAKRAREMSSEHLKDPSIKAQEFTLDSLKSQLNDIYGQNCEDRPKQLMLNFIAHGSYNGGSHTLCTREGMDPISVRSIASHIKTLKNKDPNCDKPILGVIDTACKSGGSIKEFQGLGCTLSTTSTYNQTNFGFIEQYINKIKSEEQLQNLSDLHLDLLLNRDYELLEKDFDDGKTILKRLFDNANQIAGCYDEDKADFNIALNKNLVQTYSPACEDPVAILTLRREKEISEIENIVKKLNIKQGIDKTEIAKVLGINPKEVPSSENLVRNLDALIKEDQIQSSKLDSELIKESVLMSNPEMNKMSPCKLALPKTSKEVSANDLKQLNRILTSQTAPYPDHKIALVKALCHVHSNKEDFSRCVKNESSGYLNISYIELMRLEKSYNLLQSEEKDLLALKSINESKKSDLKINITILLETYKATIKECMQKAQFSSNPAISNAAKFIAVQYSIDSKNCNDQIGCQVLKAKQREDTIKNILGIARAYFFLECRDNFKKNDDLKTCESFKI